MINDCRETAVNYVVGEKTITVFTAENKYISKVRKFSESYPNEVIIKCENDDGSLVAEMPIKWFKFPRPPKKVSDENRAAAAERMKKVKRN